MEADGLLHRTINLEAGGTRGRDSGRVFSPAHNGFARPTRLHEHHRSTGDFSIHRKIIV